jgi:hypothetical protein
MTPSVGILARWYAEPLSHNEAQKLLALSLQREQALLKRSASSPLSPLLKLIALYWLGEPLEAHYHHLLSKRSRSAHSEILKPLIYGQLLMSQRREGAMEYLDEAFQRSRQLLRPEDYFTVMKRQTLLREIPLSPVMGAAPSPRKALNDEKVVGEGLESLLTTAAVIARMKTTQEKKAKFNHDPNDTYG